MGSIQEFILKRKELGHITAARFDVSMTLGEEWGKAELLQDNAIEFSLASVDLPTVRGNYEQVYFDTMPVEVFKNFTYDPDFSMTVICDNEGKIYKQFLDLILRKEGIVDDSAKFNGLYGGNFDFKQKVDPDISLTVTALGDRDTKSGQMHFGFGSMTSETGMIFKLAGVYIKNVGNLSFSNTGSEIITFSVNAAATSFDVISKEDNGVIFSNGIYAVQKMFNPLANAIASAVGAATDALRKGGAGNNDGMEQTNVPVMPEDESYENFREQNPDIVNEESAEGPMEETTQLPTDQSNTLKATESTLENESSSNNVSYVMKTPMGNLDATITKNNEGKYSVTGTLGDQTYTIPINKSNGKYVVDYDNITNSKGEKVSFKEIGQKNGLNALKRQGAKMALNNYVSNNFESLVKPLENGNTST